MNKILLVCAGLLMMFIIPIESSAEQLAGFPSDRININDNAIKKNLDYYVYVKGNTDIFPQEKIKTDTDGVLIIQIPQNIKPGNYDLIIKDTSEKMINITLIVLPNIFSLSPTIGRPIDVVTIQGKGFGNYNKKSYVKIGNVIADIKKDEKDTDDQKTNWNDDNIKIVIPNTLKGNFDLQVYNAVKEGGFFSNIAKLGVYASDLDSIVADTIKMKKSGVSDAAIIEHLYNSKECDEQDLKCKGHGIGSLTGAQVERLKQNGFQDEFISKFQGYKQNVSLGVSTVWLSETRNYAIAPILRVLIVPRSYFYDYRPFWIKTPICWKEHCLRSPSGIFQFDRWDLNFGITNTTSTDSQTGNTDSKNYILIGASLAVNREALLNIGYAAVSGNTSGKDSQAYVGITVDYNILKTLGIVEK